MNQYFSHDYKARSDKKLVSLAMKHGMVGIGLYWCIVEMLYEEGGYVLRNEYERIAFELREHSDSIKSVIEGFNLFDFDDDKFWSNSVLKRIQLRDEKSEKARKSVEKRWNNTNVLQSKNDGNTIKVKENKVNKIKENIIPEYLSSVWPKYVEMRKKIKKPMTECSAQLALNKLSELSLDCNEQIKIVEQSIFNSWQGLFPLKSNAVFSVKNNNYGPKELTPEKFAEQMEFLRNE